MKLKAFAGQQHDAHIATHLMMGLSPTVQANPLAASELQKHILEHIRIKAEEDVEADLFKAYGTDPDRMVSEIQKEGMVALRIATYMQEMRSMQDELTGGEGPDPLIKLKETEIQQRAQADQARIALDEKRLVLDQKKQQETQQLNQQKLAVQQSKNNQPPGGPYAA
jgi:hypothetical protein